MPGNSETTGVEPHDERAVPQAPLGGTRSQSMQRLQVGLFGLGAMVLLVGLANVINNARQSDEPAPPEVVDTVTAEPSAPRDPLADAGVIPDLPAETNSEGGVEARDDDRVPEQP